MKKEGKTLAQNSVASPIEEPKGFVIYFGNKHPVTWKRETERYVYEVRRVEKENEMWFINQKMFDEKMDKEEIYLLNGSTYR